MRDGGSNAAQRAVGEEPAGHDQPDGGVNAEEDVDDEQGAVALPGAFGEAGQGDAAGDRALRANRAQGP